MPARYIIRGLVAIYGGSKVPEGKSKKWNHEGIWERFIATVESTHGFKLIYGKKHHMKVWLEWSNH